MDRIDSQKRSVARAQGIANIAEKHLDYMTNLAAAWPLVREELGRLWDLEQRQMQSRADRQHEAVYA